MTAPKRGRAVNPPRPPVDGQFRQPDRCDLGPAGHILSVDGYINSRVAKFDKNGDWIKSFGVPGRTAPRRTQHAAQHRGRCQRQHLCGGSGNRRIQVFDSNGTFQRYDHDRCSGSRRCETMDGRPNDS